MKKIYLLLCFAVFLEGFGQNFNPADIDTTFNDFEFPENHYFVDFPIRKLKIVENNKVFVLTYRSIYRLDGNSLDTSFNVGTFSQIDGIPGNFSDFAIQPDGKILVSGGFEYYDGQSRRSLLRLNHDGSLDTSFTLGLRGYVKKIILQEDGKIVIFGSDLGNRDGNNVRRLNNDGSLDTTFNIPVSYYHAINDIAVQNDGKVIIIHSNPNDSSEFNKMVRLNVNGTLDSSFTPASFFIRTANQNEDVELVKVYIQNDNKILVSGKFHGCNDIRSNGLIRLNADGPVDSSFVLGTGFGHSYQTPMVYDIIEQEDNKIIVSGNFELGGNFKILRLNADGSRDNTFLEGSRFINIGTIFSVDVFSDGTIIAGGDYDTEYRNYDSYIVKLNSDGTRNPDINNKGKGFFSNYSVETVAETSDGKILVGGTFHTYNDVKCFSFTRLNQDGSLDNTLTYGGSTGFDTDDRSFITIITAITENTDGKIYIGGNFTKFNGQACNRLIRMNPDGTRDMSFDINYGFNSGSTITPTFSTILPKPDGGVFIAGTFNRYNNTESRGLVSLSTTGALLATYYSSSSNDGVSCVKYQDNNKLLVGLSESQGGFKRLNVADLHVDNTFLIDPVFTRLSVYSFQIQQDGKIIINGKFRKNGNDNSIARILSNGALDTSFNFDLQNANYVVNDFSLLPDQKILITVIDLGSHISKLMRLNNDGSIDDTFEQQVIMGEVKVNIKTTRNGSVLLYGSDFVDYQGHRVGGLGRLMGENYYYFRGQNKLDLNGNGCDTQDSVFSNLKYRVSGEGVRPFDFIANASGSFNMGLTPGDYVIAPTFENPGYFSASPPNVTLDFPVENSPIVQDFCITPVGNHPDLEVIVFPLEVARPGFNVKYKILLKNKGNQLQSGTVNLNYADAIMDFVSSQPTVSSRTTNNLNWNFVDLKPFGTKEYFFTVNLNRPTEIPPVTDATILEYTVSVASNMTDETPSDNIQVFNQNVVNSFDPNDKTCLEGASIKTTKVGDYVHYLIRFENTGTYHAQNITVEDIIDITKFDINSLVPLDGSHSFTTTIYDGKRVEFLFQNINLPFSNDLNDGYLIFKIKTLSSLSEGDIFSNSAAIYFDYNAPILTNKASTSVERVLSNEDFFRNNTIVVYPNPVKDALNISKIDTINLKSISIYNMLGQLMIVLPNAKNIKSVDVSGLPSGSYILNATTDGNVSSVPSIKFLKI